jgi:hypothetical protein
VKKLTPPGFSLAQLQADKADDGCISKAREINQVMIRYFEYSLVIMMGVKVNIYHIKNILNIKVIYRGESGRSYSPTVQSKSG